MAWTDAFKRKLDVGGSPMFALDFQTTELLSSFGDYVPTRYVLHSHAGDGREGDVPHSIANVSGAGHSVSVGSWSSRAGGIRVKLASPAVAALVAKKIPRGMLCYFKVAFEGTSSGGWNTMGLYQYQGLSGSENDWTMTFGDHLSALQSARGRGARIAQPLFGGVKQSAISSDWNVLENFIEIPTASASAIFQDEATGAQGLLYCEPETGQPFYLKYNGIQHTSTPRRILNVYQKSTGVAATVIGTAGPVNMGAASKISHVDYIFEDLPTIAERYMIDEDLPRGSMNGPNHNMGLGFYEGIFNTTDWDRWKTRWGKYQAFKADWVSQKTISNPIRELQKFMGRFGAWIVIKEGGLSWRFVQHMLDDSSIPLYLDYEINDTDIISLDRYEQYNSDSKSAISNVNVTWFGGGGSYEFPVTLPSTDDDVGRLETVVFNDEDHASNQTNAQTHMRSRLDAWYKRVPESYTLNLRGWRWAELAPGDVCSISSDYLYDLTAATYGTGLKTLSDSAMMVTNVNVNWNDFSTTVEFTRLPQKANPYI